MADSISSDELRNLLVHHDRQIILLDCRAFISFNEGHIKESQSVICPSIVKRRSGGNIPLDNIIRCAKSKAALLDGKIRTVVAYDDAAHNISTIERDCNLYLVLKCLCEDLSIRGVDVRFLEGKYENFDIKLIKSHFFHIILYI